jgi:K+-transporting ATPase KdpF subunit
MKPSVIALLLSVLIGAGFDSSPSSGYILGIVLSIIILGYLLFSLFKPEKF